MTDILTKWVLSSSFHQRIDAGVYFFTISSLKLGQVTAHTFDVVSLFGNNWQQFGICSESCELLTRRQDTTQRNGLDYVTKAQIRYPQHILIGGQLTTNNLKFMACAERITSAEIIFSVWRRFSPYKYKFNNDRYKIKGLAPPFEKSSNTANDHWKYFNFPET